jgi:AAA+ superfamily predicted ATPase
MKHPPKNPDNNNNKNKNNIISPITTNKKNNNNDKKPPYKDLSNNEVKRNFFLTWGDLNENRDNLDNDMNNKDKTSKKNNLQIIKSNKKNEIKIINENKNTFDDIIEQLTNDIIDQAMKSYCKKKDIKTLDKLKQLYLPSDYLNIETQYNSFENTLQEINYILYTIDENLKKINEIKQKYTQKINYLDNKPFDSKISPNTNLALTKPNVSNIFAFNPNKTYPVFKNPLFNPKTSPFTYNEKLPPISRNPTIKKEKINIQVTINSIKDILDLVDKYPLKWDVEYNINMNALHKIKDPLIKLDNMIGMINLKNSIVDQILYFIQNFHKNKYSKNSDFLHTVIYGPPGTGKTEIAKIIGLIYSKIGILNKNSFKKVTRSDLIAGYLGQTALKTKEVVEKSLGGVLFIDEAYALGNPEKKDSFAKECLDTLCEALSDYKENLMVIIAGYENELKKCFFEYNQGLDSRFTWRFKTDDYNYEELFLIFKKKVNDIAWTLNAKVKSTWFKDKMDYFIFYGRDMETLLAKVKIAHSRRVFCLDETFKRNINIKDMDNGFDIFINNDEVKNRKSNINDFYQQMYC